MDSIVNSPIDFELNEDNLLPSTSLITQKLELELKEYNLYLDSRKVWSAHIRAMVWIIIGMNIIFIIFVGFGWWNFKNPWLGRIIFAGNFTDVLGLAFILVKHLYPEKDHKNPRNKGIVTT